MEHQLSGAAVLDLGEIQVTHLYPLWPHKRLVSRVVSFTELNGGLKQTICTSKESIDR